LHREELGDISEDRTKISMNQTGGSASREMARRAVHGAAALVVRQVIVYGSNIAGGIVLARLLSPSDFGFYGLILFFLVFLNIFGGTGFASNLIRTEEEASLSDYRTVFAAQQLGIGILFIGIWIAAPWIGSAYHMHHGSAFFRLVGVALVLTSMMVIPQVQMERELAFDKVAVVEAAQALVFNLLSVLLAWRGLGVLSFSIALAARAAVGAVISNIMEPWRMGWNWDTGALGRHMRFGLALQAGQLISMAKDSITPIFVGLYLGAAQMGYVTWAVTLSGYPIMVLMPLQRLYLPFFARLQSDRKELGRFVSHALWMANAIAAPLTVVTIALAHPITVLIFGGKWLAALPLFYCLSLGIIFSPSSTPLLGVLNAVGKSNLTLLISGLWMFMTWAFGVPLMIKFGLVGFGMAIILVQISNLVLYWLVWDKLAVSPWPAYWPSWPIAAILGLALRLLERFDPTGSTTVLIARITVTLLVYGAILWFVFPKHTRAWVRILRKNSLTVAATGEHEPSRQSRR
jgi:O-antigen/teichoic acid export membrane protein